VTRGLLRAFEESACRALLSSSCVDSDLHEFTLQ